MTEFLQIANALADLARPIALKYFRSRALEIEHKSDDTPVTLADREIETAMREFLAQKRPQDSIFGEEHGHSNPDAEYTWILDPIDGTKAFSVGRPNFGVLIALWHRDRGIILGLCDLPATHDRWHTGQGGVYMNGKMVTARPTKTLDRAIFACTDPLRLPPRVLSLVQNIRERASITTYGGDCLNYALVASGFIDCIVEGRQQLYDIAPFVPMIEQAGGKITQLSGAPIGFVNDDLIIAASTPELHAEILQLYNSL